MGNAIICCTGCILDRAPRTKETSSDFCKIMGPGKGDTTVWYWVTRHPQVFRGLTVSQRSLGFWGVTFRPCEKCKEILNPEVPYLSTIGALMFLANCTLPDNALPVNLLFRYIFAPTRRHWNDIKHI